MNYSLEQLQAPCWMCGQSVHKIEPPPYGWPLICLKCSAVVLPLGELIHRLKHSPPGCSKFTAAIKVVIEPAADDCHVVYVQ